MRQLKQLFELVQNDPALSVIVASIFILLGALQYTLGPDADWVQSIRSRYWLKIHEILTLFGGYAKTIKREEDYVYSVKVSEERLEEILYKGGYHRNVLAAKKQRILPDGTKEDSIGSWVHRESLKADMQGHATIFPGHKKGEVDVYHHYETSWVTHPFKHYFNAKQINGDPKDTLFKAINQSGAEYYKDDKWLNMFN